LQFLIIIISCVATLFASLPLVDKNFKTCTNSTESDESNKSINNEIGGALINLLFYFAYFIIFFVTASFYLVLAQKYNNCEYDDAKKITFGIAMVFLNLIVMLSGNDMKTSESCEQNDAVVFIYTRILNPSYNFLFCLWIIFLIHLQKLKLVENKENKENEEDKEDKESDVEKEKFFNNNNNNNNNNNKNKLSMVTITQRILAIWLTIELFKLFELVYFDTMLFTLFYIHMFSCCVF
jgi:large-conductance mechanosensitive channel